MVMIRKKYSNRMPSSASWQERIQKETTGVYDKKQGEFKQ